MSNNIKNFNPVYTFQNGILTIEAYSFNVSSIKIFLTENAIPFARITVNPTTINVANVAVAQRAHLFGAKNIHKFFQEHAVKKSTAHLNLDILQENDVVQSIQLKNWVVTGAGMKSITARGGFDVEVEIQHPAIFSNFSGARLGFIKNYPAFSFDGLNIVGTYQNPLHGLATAAKNSAMLPRKINTKTPTQCVTSTQNINTTQLIGVYLDRIKNAANALLNYFVWDYPKNWPLMDCLPPQALNGLKYHINRIVGADPKEVNLFNLFVYSLAEDFFISISPTWLEPKLTVRPFMPWTNYKPIYIPAERISDVNFPAVDSVPIAGVRVLPPNVDSISDYTVFLPQSTPDSINSNTEFFEILYIPDMSAINNGTIITVSYPAWFDFILSSLNLTNFSGSAASNAASAFTPSDMTNDTVLAATNDALVSIYRDLIFGIGQRYAEAIFQLSFRQNTEMTVYCPLSIADSNGNTIVPGTTCHLLDEGQNTIYEFYVTEVQHVIDRADAMAMTSISGKYVRPAGGFKGVIQSGVKPALWG